MMWVGLFWMVVGDCAGGGGIIALRSPSPLGPQGPEMKKCLRKATTPTTTNQITHHHPT